MTTLLETVSESEGPNLLLENMWFGNCGSNSSTVHGNLPLCPWLNILSNFIGERNPPKHHRVMRLLTLLSPLNIVSCCAEAWLVFFFVMLDASKSRPTSGMGLAVTTSFCQIVRVELCHQYVDRIMTSFCLWVTLMFGKPGHLPQRLDSSRRVQVKVRSLFRGAAQKLLVTIDLIANDFPQ